MRIGIVTPSYNQPDWLRLCIASVADQTQGNAPTNESETPILPASVEHIIQDGGSRGIEVFAREMAAFLKEQHGGGERPVELTGELLHFATPAGYTLRIISERDDGMYDAINRGLRRSTGQICAYLNCDEQYLPGALRKVGSFFQSAPGTELLFGDVILVDEHCVPLACRQILVPTKLHTRFVHLATLSCATFFRRSLLDRGLYFDPDWKVIGDGVWMSRLLESGVSMDTLRKPLAAFALTGRNLGRSEGDAAEGARWTGRPDAPPRWMKMPVTLIHRVRRFLAGAQFSSVVPVSLYTPDSPGARVDFGTRRLSARWPG